MGCAPCAIPLRGSMANCMTLVRIVMAPTAMSPPYLKKRRVEAYRNDAFAGLHDERRQTQSQAGAK